MGTDVHYDLASLDRDGYWACARPEAPPDFDRMYFHEHCRACMVMLAATICADPDAADGYMETVCVDGSRRIDGETPAAVYDEYRGEHGLPPLPCGPSS